MINFTAIFKKYIDKNIFQEKIILSKLIRGFLIYLLLGSTIIPMILMLFTDVIHSNLTLLETKKMYEIYWISFLEIYRSDFLIWTAAITLITLITGITIHYNVIKAKYSLERAVFNEKRFKELFDKSIDSICILDADGNFVDCNKATTELFEAEKEEIIGKSVKEFVYSEDQNKSAHYFHLLKTEGAYQGYEGRIMSKAGNTKFIEVNSVGLKKDGDLWRSVDIVRDITQRKLAEEKLDIANKEREKIFKIISHDLRSPFNSLQGYSSLIKKEYDNLEESEKKEIIHSIDNISHETFNLLENLLLWSQSKTELRNINKQVYNLNELVTETIKLQSNVAKAKNISIHPKVMNDLKVSVDKNMILTVIRNLISNAIKFTQRDGTIKIYSEISSNKILLTVEDNGLGMDENTKNNLFNLSNISKPGTNSEPGAGLGLILAKELMEKNGGKILVQSTLNEGSKFTIVFPDNRNENYIMK